MERVLMGKYFGVKAVRAKGQKLEVGFGKSQPRVPSGKRLVGIPNNGAYEVAQDLTNPSDYDALFGSYMRGNWLGCDLYLLEESRVAECPDEGRNNIL
jgi:hypothetical protein